MQPTWPLAAARLRSFRWVRGWWGPQQTGLKEVPITWNISGRIETEIGSKPRQEFVGILCCFGNLHLLTPVNHFLQSGLKFFRGITWDFSARAAQTGLKLPSCNRELRFSSVLSEGRVVNLPPLVSTTAHNRWRLEVLTFIESQSQSQNIITITPPHSLRLKNKFTCHVILHEFVYVIISQSPTGRAEMSAQSENSM